MTEMVLDTNTLPDRLARLIRADKVRIRETRGEILLTPVRTGKIDCPLFGILKDGKCTSEQFMAEKEAEKELEEW
jgi:hypothetical protein